MTRYKENEHKMTHYIGERAQKIIEKTVKRQKTLKKFFYRR